jgi:putative transposase
MAVAHLWATNITSIPLRTGFLHLVAIMDLFSRHVYSFGETFGYS